MFKGVQQYIQQDITWDRNQVFTFWLLKLLTWGRRGTWSSLHPLSRWATLWMRGGRTCAFHHVFSPGKATGVQTSAGNHPSPWPLHAPCWRSRRRRPAHQLTGVEKPRPRSAVEEHARMTTELGNACSAATGRPQPDSLEPPEHKQIKNK